MFHLDINSVCIDHDQFTSKPHSECYQYNQRTVSSTEQPAQLVKMWVRFTEIHFKGLVTVRHAHE